MARSVSRRDARVATRAMANLALILANPVVKRGERAVREVVQKLTAAYEQQGRQVIARYTERDGARETQIVAEYANQAETIVAVGGDGTVRETVLAMTDAQRASTPIGFVPMGNANVLAREVGIALHDQDKAIEQAVHGHRRLMDVGTVNGQPTFLLMLDAGYFARVVHRVAAIRNRPSTRWMYRLGGDLLYGGIGMLNLLIPGAAQVEVVTDDGAAFTTSSLAIANAATYAKNGSFCPDADPSDGVLDFNASRGNKTMRHSLAAMTGKPKPAISHIGKATRFSLRAISRGFLCQVDGDPLFDGPVQRLTIEVRSGYYSLLVPRPG